MAIIIEILLCVIMASGIVIGIRLGFIRMAAKPVKLILALVLAFSLCSKFADAVITPMIDGPVSNYVTSFLYENCAELTAENAEEELPTLLKFAASLAGINVTEAAGTGDVIANLAEVLVDPVIRVVSVIVSFVAVYIISRIGLFLLFLLIGFFFRDGIFGFANKLLGVVLATLITVTLAWGVAVLLELIFHIPALADDPTFADFEGGFFYRFFNEYNPMELLLSF